MDDMDFDLTTQVDEEEFEEEEYQEETWDPDDPNSPDAAPSA
jgi:hypothetical protein